MEWDFKEKDADSMVISYLLLEFVIYKFVFHLLFLVERSCATTSF